jgi:hypothetical protein
LRLRAHLVRTRSRPPGRADHERAGS